MVKCNVSSQGYEGGGGGRGGGPNTPQLGGLCSVISVQGQQSYSLCYASGMCLLTPSVFPLIRAALLVLISEWSLIGERVPLSSLSHSDFHLHCLQQVIMRNIRVRDTGFN